MAGTTQARVRHLGVAAVAGAVAASALVAVSLLLRWTWGIPTTAELAGDRVASWLSVDLFLGLLALAGGYNRMKQLGIVSVLSGYLVAGAAIGILADHASRRGWPLARRLPLTGTRFVALLAGLLCVGTVIALWPTLSTNFHGLPATQARGVTVVALLAQHVLFAWILGTLQAETSPAPADANPDRRRLLAGLGVLAVAAAPAGFLLRRLYRVATFSYDGLQLHGTDLTPITPNDRFYVVTKNVIDPDVKRSLWWLEIRGAVAAPQAYSYEALTALPSVDQRTTLQCISNSVGGGLVSNAVWRGVPLRALLIAARPSPAAVQILLQGVDGYRDTIPLEQALAEHTLVAYAMNGDSLPGRHGFPVRLIVPGLVGEKSVKWLTRVVVNEKPTTGFYEGQGWGPNFVLQTHSRFYAPDFGRPLPAGAPIVLRGTAFAGARGIREVDVRVDDGPWQRADIDYSGAAIEWVHWRMVWTPERPGEYRLTVRATDGDGVLQTAVERGFAPEGATGHHRVVARVVNTAA